MVRKTTSPITWRLLFKEGCSPFHFQARKLSGFFFLFWGGLIFLGPLVHCLFIVMVTLENMGVGDECWGVTVNHMRV